MAPGPAIPAARQAPNNHPDPMIEPSPVSIRAKVPTSRWKRVDTFMPGLLEELGAGGLAVDPHLGGVPMLGDEPVLDTEHIEPGHVIDVVAIDAIAHLAREADHDDVAFRDDGNDGDLDTRSHRSRRTLLGEQLDPRGTPGF